MRLRSWLTALLLVLVLVPPSRAVILTQPLGDLWTCTGSCATGTSPDQVAPGGSWIMCVELDLTAGTIVSQLQTCIEKNVATCDANSSWSNVGALSTDRARQCVSAPPLGFYRIDLTTCTGCTFRYFFRRADVFAK